MLTEKEWDGIIAANLQDLHLPPVLGLGNDGRHRGKTSILPSACGVFGYPFSVAYNAASRCLSVTQTLAVEWARLMSRSTRLAGFVETPMNAKPCRDPAEMKTYRAIPAGLIPWRDCSVHRVPCFLGLRLMSRPQCWWSMEGFTAGGSTALRDLYVSARKGAGTGDEIFRLRLAARSDHRLRSLSDRPFLSAKICLALTRARS